MKRTAVFIGLIGALLASAAPAQAQSPVGCKGNRISADLLKDRSYIRDGEIMYYTVKAANNAAGACSASTVTLRLEFPNAAGDPSGVFLNLTNAISFTYPTPEITLGPYAYVARFGPTPPDRYTARLTSDDDSKVHDVPFPYSKADVLRTLQTLTVRPALTVEKVGSTTGGPAPQNVVYTYTVKNQTLPAGLPDDVSQMRNVVPIDDLCAPLTLVSGDDNGDGIMQVIETWTYTCGQTFTRPEVYTNKVTVCADEVADGISKNYCSPPDTWTVTVTPPPPVAQGAVKPQSVSQAPKCTLATPSGLKVRAREQTTIKVTVRNVDAGTLARITLPGGKVVRKRTNDDGVATFKVTPTKTGTATIRAAACADVERLTVRPARQVVAQRVPRVTG